MGNKMKKLICSLLATAMLVTSVGVVAIAADEDETTAADTTVTETVADDASTADQTDEEKEADDTAADAEATEAPAAEATEAPVATTSSDNGSYENDDYYKKALTLDSALGIISGYEDGSVRPESKVTRAEMASIVLRMLNLSGDATYQNIFTDVNSSHWAANQIQAAYDAGVINGMGDGTFAPDSEVTYAQVIVMLVNAMNYTQDAEYFGGWQQGYVKAAGDIGLLKNASGSNDVASDRGVVIKMVYNALLNDYKNPTSYDAYGNPKYETDKTLSEVKFDLKEAKGVLEGTYVTTISNEFDIQEGQIDIRPEVNGVLADKGTLYETPLTGLEDYIAQKVTYYYRENSGINTEVLAVIPNTAQSETFEVTDMDDVEKIDGFADGKGSIKLEGVSKAKDCEGAQIVFNGKLITPKEYNDAKAALNATSDAYKRLKDNFDEFITPENGSIRLVKRDSSSDKYDVVFINSYDTVIITSVTSSKINGDYCVPVDGASTAKEISNTISYSANIDDKEDRTITVTKAGEEARPRNLKKDDVAAIKRSLDDTVIDVIVSGESITGAATGVTIKLNDSRATVNGDKYNVANIAVGDLKAGTQSTFYLDPFGNIARIDTNSSGKLDSGEKYGWLMAAYDSENGNDYLLDIMTADGTKEQFKLGNTVDYWGPKMSIADHEAQGSGLKEADAKTAIETLMASDANFVQMDTTPIRLVKYKANSSGKITRLYVAVDKTAVTDEDCGAVRVDTQNLNGKGAVGGTVLGYSIADGITEFTVPKLTADMKDASNYAVGEVKASNYVVKENGSSANFIVGEFDGAAPQILVKFTDSSSSAALMTDMDSANAGPLAMVVDQIDEGVNDDEDRVYTINGYIGLNQVSVTTNKATTFGILTKKFKGGAGNNKYFFAPTFWEGTNAYKNVELTDYLKEGDIILYTGDGRLIAKFSDGEFLGDYVYGNAEKYDIPEAWKPSDDEVHKIWNYKAAGKEEYQDWTTDGYLPTGYNTFTSSRVMYYFGPVEDFDSSAGWVTVAGETVGIDPQAAIDLIYVDRDGRTEMDSYGTTLGDLIEFDADEQYGDYIYVSTKNKGDINNIVVYRFED